MRRPIRVTTTEKLKETTRIVLVDWRLKVREIGQTMGISHSSMISISNEQTIRQFWDVSKNNQWRIVYQLTGPAQQQF